MYKRCRSERSVGLNGEYRDAAAEVICNECKSSRRIDTHVGWTSTMRAYGVQMPKFTRASLNGERADRTAVAFVVRDLVHGVEILSGRMKAQPRGTRRFCRELQQRKMSCRGICLEQVDPLAIRGAIDRCRVGAHIGQSELHGGVQGASEPRCSTADSETRNSLKE